MQKASLRLLANSDELVSKTLLQIKNHFSPMQGAGAPRGSPQAPAIISVATGNHTIKFQLLDTDIHSAQNIFFGSLVLA